MIDKEEHDTINSFYNKIHKATIDGEGWVETSKEIINHYNKSGLGLSDYFIFQGINVCEYGKSEDIIKKLSRQLGQILYGESEGQVHQGTQAQMPAVMGPRR